MGVCGTYSGPMVLMVIVGRVAAPPPWCESVSLTPRGLCGLLRVVLDGGSPGLGLRGGLALGANNPPA